MPLSPPAARLPLARRPWRREAWLSLALHAALLLAVVWHGRALLEGGSEGGGRRGERPAVQFFTLPEAAPMMAVELPPAPTVALTEIPPLTPLAVDLPRLDIGATTLPRGAPGGVVVAGTGARGMGAGGDVGPGTGSTEGYILPPNPRGVIVPPGNPPRSVRGRQFRVQFWVAEDGGVTRVAITPEIEDAKYRREFHERMRQYRFYPATTRDGRHVSSVIAISITP